jgi:hypothetical protein
MKRCSQPSGDRFTFRLLSSYLVIQFRFTFRLLSSYLVIQFRFTFRLLSSYLVIQFRFTFRLLLSLVASLPLDDRLFLLPAGVPGTVLSEPAAVTSSSSPFFTILRSLRLMFASPRMDSLSSICCK